MIVIYTLASVVTLLLYNLYVGRYTGEPENRERAGFQECHRSTAENTIYWRTREHAESRLLNLSAAGVQWRTQDTLRLENQRTQRKEAFGQCHRSAAENTGCTGEPENTDRKAFNNVTGVQRRTQGYTGELENTEKLWLPEKIK